MTLTGQGQGMSDVDRESPRAAIRKWIQNTENKSKLETSDPRPEQQKGEGRIRHRSESRSGRRYRSVGHESGSKKQAHDELGGRHKPPKIRELQSKLIVEEPQRVNPRQKLQFRKDPKPRPGEPGFAEHLELHAPFRNFKVQGDDPGIDVKTTSLRRKRRHTTSSTSSYLEPAICNDISEDHETERVITQNSGMLLPSQTASPSPKKPTKTYERRSRHKTREDRYELKDSYNKEKRKKAAKKAGREKEPKDKKRRDKLGAALMHEFKAQNVSHDRLTVSWPEAYVIIG